MSNKLQIKCTTSGEAEKIKIKSIFKKHHISMAGFVMEKLREKADRLEGEG